MVGLAPVGKCGWLGFVSLQSHIRALDGSFLDGIGFSKGLDHWHVLHEPSTCSLSLEVRLSSLDGSGLLGHCWVDLAYLKTHLCQ